MFELPALQNVSKVVIDENTVINDTKPLLIYGESPRAAAADA
jgi:ATP-dependent Clp protease ATP-binding subunit ClpX